MSQYPNLENLKQLGGLDSGKFVKWTNWGMKGEWFGEGVPENINKGHLFATRGYLAKGCSNLEYTFQ